MREKMNGKSSVKWLGSQAEFVAGNVKEPIALERLSRLKGLYAIGPVEEGRGEVSIFNSVPLISTIENDAVRIDRDFHCRAGFLVYATVESWASAGVLSAADNESDFIRILLRSAAAHGVFIDAPFPFLMLGLVEDATLHVLSNRSEAPYSPELHEKAKVRFPIADMSVEIVGFYSRSHRGVFTPRDSDVHMHARTLGNGLCGHLETIRSLRNMSLYLPVKNRGVMAIASDDSKIARRRMI